MNLDKLENYVTERNERYGKELESWLRKWLVDEYPERSERLWSRRYESVEAFLESVKPNRNRYKFSYRQFLEMVHFFIA